jgi:predicted O-methyltransferase YrrM
LTKKTTQHFKAMNLTLQRLKKIMTYPLLILRRLYNDNYQVDLKALLCLQGLVTRYIPWSSSAMQPAAVARLVNEVIINRRRSAIEFGSGVSTIYLAAIFKQEGSGIVYSIDHDAEWIDIMQDLIDSEGLGEFVKLIHAPLESTEFGVGGLKWYSVKILKATLMRKKFDLAIVDGPLACTQELEMTRYPALPFLLSDNLLAEKHIIVLDDAQRPGEKRIIRRWSQEYRYYFAQKPNLGIAVSIIGRSLNA